MPLPSAEHSAHGPGYEARKQRLDITIQMKRAMGAIRGSGGETALSYNGHDGQFWQFWLADIPSVHSID